MKPFKLAKSYRVENGAHFRLKDFNPADTGDFKSKEEADEKLQKDIERMEDLQDKLYAQDNWAVLLVFQALDAAGKDGTIKHVMSGVNPEGCQVHSFKGPSETELQHDFLWRTTRQLPERGHIGIFNRSYYEEVLVVRVHSEMLKNEKTPPSLVTKKIWEERFEDIHSFERHMWRNGTVIRKFFLHLSKKRAEEALPGAPRRAGKELEILRGRHSRARILGRLSERVRRNDSRHSHQTCALVRSSGGQ